MKSSFGTALQYTLFGESHSTSIGITIQGLPAGITIDFAKIDEQLTLRSGRSNVNTPRKEKNEYEIISGYFNDKTTGTPLTVLFRNTNTQSKDYSNLINHPRPGHADYTAKLKYQDNQDYRGGGHFSGRLTTPLVFLGTICTQLLQVAIPGFAIASHIAAFGNIDIDNYHTLRKKLTETVATRNGLTAEKFDLVILNDSLQADDILTELNKVLHDFHEQLQTLAPDFPLINPATKASVVEIAETCQERGDSIGGQIETIVINPPLAVGEPFFNSVESVLASLLYSVGSVKGVDFGYGVNFAQALGQTVKDEIIAIDNGRVQTLYNYNGGLNGGITNGEDIVIQTTIKPIASLMQQQASFNLATQQIEQLKITGRHDVTIINRIIPVINSMVAIGLYDLYLQK